MISLKDFKRLKDEAIQSSFEVIEPLIVDPRIFEYTESGVVANDYTLARWIGRNIKVRIKQGQNSFYVWGKYEKFNLKNKFNDDLYYNRFLDMYMPYQNEEFADNFCLQKNYILDTSLLDEDKNYYGLIFDTKISEITFFSRYSYSNQKFLVTRQNDSNLSWKGEPYSDPKLNTAKVDGDKKLKKQEAPFVDPLPDDYLKKRIYCYDHTVIPDEVYCLHIENEPNSDFEKYVGLTFKGGSNDSDFVPRDTFFMFIRLTLIPGIVLKVGDEIEISSYFNNTGNLYATVNNIAIAKNAKVLWNINTTNELNPIYVYCLVAFKKQVGLEIADAREVLTANQYGFLEQNAKTYSLIPLKEGAKGEKI
ncbi:hypothetical protein [Candidatus Endomicrobiellum devescovinae]|jgi:hypothetical protein|uniref:hypothetical protein n=1 Tax=Candidatus Endomicrobiellum devescovinae TaxID=3242322 RepID=UPI0028288B38|nr:hypothetical protein [Endomicrobium sp.]